MNGRPRFKSLKSREDVLRLHDGCRALLLFCNSQNPSGVLMSGSFEPHWGIHHVAFRGTALHGRRQTSGVRHGRLVDALGRLRPGWNSGFDGLKARSHSSRTEETTMASQHAATGPSILAEVALVAACAQQIGQRLLSALTRHVPDVFDSYRPELHYMRGPGPRWREKHGITARDRRFTAWSDR